MKTLLSIALILASTTSAVAATKEPANLELCTLELYEPSEELFITEEIFDVRKATSVSKLELKMLNAHLNYISFEEPKEFTFEDVKAAFANGFDELYILKLTSRKTGKVYLETKSYPGDNAYGLVFDLKGNVIAQNGDDSYTLIGKDGSEFSCYEVNKDKYDN
ncbi:hypothetical protein AZI87_02855 [Bdellovibrio bacteriovorus]|uniref:Uncharacterized protein n=1 Tax=Bdellovibrio bacteriovorus TaxID=959 RepID=A0A162GI86_BDEBC|nr:hypothetical protein [Bdellovibrio bacteriovorus]KYG68213.1 hypothetical protein AZI87_02855 [Bdellovibrio bacteriovorus]